MEQAQDQSQRVARMVSLLARTTDMLADVYDNRVLQQLDDLQVRLAEGRSAMQPSRVQVEEMVDRIPGAGVDPLYGADHSPRSSAVAATTSGRATPSSRKEFIGCDPVVDLGFGRGEFMELLTRARCRRVPASSPTRSSSELARGRGLDVEQGFAVEYLRGLEPGSLGGIVMIQVIEHLSPQHVIDFVALAAEKVRPGGKVVLETVNPASLYTYARAFWVDPDHVRPVHPNFLGSCSARRSSAKLSIEYRSPVSDERGARAAPR